MSFVHLHNHTEYSLLNGAIRIPDLIAKAKEFEMPAVAITDYGNLFGAVEFYQKAKSYSIKPIIGCTVFHPSNDNHSLRQHRRGIDHLFQLVLLVQNKTGYQNLCKLVTQSYLEGFYYKPRVDSEMLANYSEGLIALSAGWDGALNSHLFEGNLGKAKEAAQFYASIFKDHFYLELQENGIEGQHETNIQLIDIGKELGLPVVATNSCHYLNREDAEAFETLMCIQTGATLHGVGDHLKYSSDGYYFKSIGEMVLTFSYCPEAVSHTLDIADRCQFDWDLSTYYFPKFEPPKGKSLDEYLKEEAEIGLKKRWPEIILRRNKDDELKKIYWARLHEELAMIQQMGFSGYFLIVSDFIQYAKDHDIAVGPGRGSAAGSLVAYATRITDLDPIPYNLLFERFLNPERVSMPDVDIDFCMHNRDRVLDYVAKKYGNVSQIITFGKMKARAVIRDVGRVMEMALEQVDKIAKLIPNAINITLDQALKDEPRLIELMKGDPQIARLIEVAKRLEGLNRHASTHAAGVVISDRPLSDFLPLYKGGNNDVVTQFDMKSVEKVGLIKFDFLGLKTLTVIQDSLKIIARTRNKKFNILDIPIDDPMVFDHLSKADTRGVFQLESSGMKDLLTRMKPSTFEDLIALVALYRPGPLGSGMVDDFINRKQGKTQIYYDLPESKPILEETYGVIVYQEQVMRLASVLAGYSLGEADILRRAMGKKKVEEMASQRLRFLQGALDKKIPKAKAEKIFDLMAKFAEYGFNKSHSAAYALVSYQTAYLKTHYTVEYLAAILTTEMHNTDRIQFYIQDCVAHGIKILPPDVNESYFGFSVVSETEIRFGLGAIKNVGEGAIESILEARKKEGPFTSFFDFCVRTDHHKANRRVLESLIKCGAFDSLVTNRAQLDASIDQTVLVALAQQKEKGLGQTNLFGLMGEAGRPVGVTLHHIDEWPENERLSFEKEALGFFLSGHPLQTYENELRRAATSNTLLIQNLASQSEVTVAGLFTQHRIITTKKGRRMAFATLEDLQGSIEIILFSDIFKKMSDLLTQEKPVVIKGAIDRSDEGVKLLAKEVDLLTDHLARITRSVHFRIRSPLFTEARFTLLQSILKEYQGTCIGYIHVLDEQSDTVLELPIGVNLGDEEKLSARVNHLFEERVVDFR